jgi:hypothetical protein
MLLGPEAVAEVEAWVARLGWESDEAPMVLVAP